MKTSYSWGQTLLSLVLLSPCLWGAKTADIHVYVDQPTVSLNPRLYGLFFEDINFSADGGLYGELVQNRSFEYYPVEGWNAMRDRYHPLYAWEKVERGAGECTLRVERGIPLNQNNRNYLAIAIEKAGAGVGVQNLGYNGIPLTRGDMYDVSLYARRTGRQRAPISVALLGGDDTVLGKVEIAGVTSEWQRFEAAIEASKTEERARLVLTTTGDGVLYLDMVSLFPRKTFKGRRNGLRPDLAQALAYLKPQFFRFPGGCIAHGHSLQNVYRWKDTVGDIAARKPNWNLWGYHQSYGLGYYEYFLLCEDLGAAPLPVLPVGVSCGFRPPFQVVPMEDLQPWIDDALDLIEFANGPVDSEWGRIRARMGHPEPFGLEYICLGNEEHDTPACRERFPHFVKAIRRAYPDIKILGTSGLGPGIPLYDLMEELEVYSSDEHYYQSPEWYLQNQNRFDDFDRSAPKIFVGEYASRGNTLFNALAEAAYLTGIERNGDIVDMACYAPLFAHVDYTQWRAANLIWFDKRTVVKTPNYYVQQLFSCNKGDVYLKNKVGERGDSEERPTIQGAVGIGTWSTTMALDRAEVNGTPVRPDHWHALHGNFRMQDGHYCQLDVNRQPAMSVSSKAYKGEKVTYRVRARKTGGREGFLLVFGYENEDNYYWWNVGGWGNQQHGIERVKGGQKSILIQKSGRIKADTWYDLEVELSPGRIRCYLNDQLVHDYREEGYGISISPTLDRQTNELILKLVNPTEQAVDATIHLAGVLGVGPSAQVTLLSGIKEAKNSVEAPNRIIPASKTIAVNKTFTYRLPAMSVQAIRMKVN